MDKGHAKIVGNILTRTSVAIVVAVIFGWSDLHASDAPPHWEMGWKGKVDRLSCALERTYYNRSGPSRRLGFLSGTQYERAVIQFSTNTMPLENVIPASAVGDLRFSFILYARGDETTNTLDFEYLSVKGSSTRLKLEEHGRVKMASIVGDVARQLFESLVDDVSPTFLLHLTDDTSREFIVPIQQPRIFRVWAKMYYTCVEVNSERGQ